MDSGLTIHSEGIHYLLSLRTSEAEAGGRVKRLCDGANGRLWAHPGEGYPWEMEAD